MLSELDNDCLENVGLFLYPLDMMMLRLVCKRTASIRYIGGNGNLLNLQYRMEGFCYYCQRCVGDKFFVGELPFCKNCFMLKKMSMKKETIIDTPVKGLPFSLRTIKETISDTIAPFCGKEVCHHYKFDREKYIVAFDNVMERAFLLYRHGMIFRAMCRKWNFSFPVYTLEKIEERFHFVRKLIKPILFHKFEDVMNEIDKKLFNASMTFKKFDSDLIVTIETFKYVCKKFDDCDLPNTFTIWGMSIMPGFEYDALYKSLLNMDNTYDYNYLSCVSSVKAKLKHFIKRSISIACPRLSSKLNFYRDITIEDVELLWEESQTCC